MDLDAHAILQRVQRPQYRIMFHHRNDRRVAGLPADAFDRKVEGIEALNVKMIWSGFRTRNSLARS